MSVIDERLIAALTTLGFSEKMLANAAVEPNDAANAFVRIGPGMLCTYIRYGKGEVRESHTHPEHRVTFVRSGRGTLECDGCEHALGPGSVTVLLPGVAHVLRVSKECDMHICELVIVDSGTTP
jgi:quercetin dioxygenase-like cupin family protein